MRVRNLLPLVLGSVVVASATGCQFVAGTFVAAKDAQSKKGHSSSPPTKSNSQTKLDSLLDEKIEGYQREVALRFAAADFSWIDEEATKVREQKNRFPGGSFKLRALYKALITPRTANASDGDWEDHLASMERWIKQNPHSITPRVALGHTWKEYAWKARGGGYSGTVSDAASKAFQERLDRASKVLQEASALNERCPEWYLATLWVGIGQSWERADLDRMFQTGVEIDPHYYYLYQAKATYLLPRWYGEEGEAEKFAEESALRVGGHQGDIIFFTIYSQLLSMHDLTFMNTHQQARPRILDGFRAIEKLYGTSSHRLNEACFFAIGSNDPQMVVELFTRIGDNYDPEVWRSKNNFMMFRESAFQMARMESQKQGAQPATKTK